jgi:serine/threonine protein kinase
MAKQLLVIKGKDKDRKYTLPDSGSFSIGRGNNTNTQLKDPRASRNHCLIQIDSDEVTIEDAESATGTFIDERRITQAERLFGGEVIRVGETELRFESDELAEQKTLAGDVPRPVVLEKPASGTTASPLAGLLHTTLGHFELTAELASGQSSVVFRAQDTTEAREAAVRVLLPTAAKTDGEMKRLGRALKPLLTVRHENLVGLYDVGKDAGYCWFAMELVEGESLGQIMTSSKGMIPWDHILRYGIHMCKGLVELHAHRMIHRNLTPRAFLVNSSDRRAKIGSMWRARSLDATEPESQTLPEELRDMGYLSPEQIQGSKCDERSDLYGLGATIYGLLTGRPPFEGKNLPETITKVLQASPDKPRDFQLTMPPSFESVVLKLLAKKPQDRYASASALLNDLEKITQGNLHGPSPTPGPGPTPGPTGGDNGDDVIVILCPNQQCGQRLRARRRFAGTQVRCPGCATMLTVPGQVAVPAHAVPSPAAPTPAAPSPAAPTVPPSPRTYAPHQPNLNDRWNRPRPEPTPSPSPWPKAIAVALGTLIFVGLLLYFSGLLGPSKPLMPTSPTTPSAPSAPEKPTAPTQ